MNIGDIIFVNDAIGEVIVIYKQEDYLILFRSPNQFIKANSYKYENGNLSWGKGEYYNSLAEIFIK